MNELRHKVEFLQQVRNSKKLQFFSIKLVWQDMRPKVIQNNGSVISEEWAEIEMIFYTWVGIHKYICLIQSWYVGVARCTCGCQNQFQISNLQYVKTELLSDTDFLDMGRHPLKQQIDSVISSSVTARFWSWVLVLKFPRPLILRNSLS